MNIFEKIRITKPKRSTFNLSHQVLTTTQAGRLTPFFCEEVVPGDSFNMRTAMLVRLQAMKSPILSDIDVYVHFFFVPNRLIWDKWEEFITGGDNGKEKPEKPSFKISDMAKGKFSTPKNFYKARSTYDYLGYPQIDESKAEQYERRIDVLPFRAFALIWNEYYRDQNLMNEINIHKDKSGYYNYFQKEEDWQMFLPLARCWKKDYFSSALPWSQRGEDVKMPIKPMNLNYRNQGSTVFKYSDGTRANSDGAIVDGNLKNASGTLIGVDNSNALVTDSKNAAPTVMELRRMYATQRWEERQAVGGSRYIETILSHFGVRSSDSRLQRPEYIKGGKSPVVISEVMQTAEGSNAEGSTPIATPYGKGVSVQKTPSFKRFFEEHGWVIGILSVVPKAYYCQGLPRKFTRMDKLDYFWPEFQNIGEQSILNEELAFLPGPDIGANANQWNFQDFGYAPRYSEYKWIPNTYHGEFRTSLKFWHTGRMFAQDTPSNAPKLNTNFLAVTPDSVKDVFAVSDTNYDQFLIQINNQLIAKRPMSYYGTPV